MVLKRAVLTGGSGTLGTELQKISDIFVCPSSKEMDITCFDSVQSYLSKKLPSVVVHAAAYTDVPRAETETEKVIETNVVGTYNILKWCIANDSKLVYISTDYVFDGERGNYLPHEPINPLTDYAKSKASGELIVQMYRNSLTIRTSFYGNKFPYDKAIEDQWTTKDYVDIMAPKILSEIVSDKTGVVHCYGKKDNVYNIARRRNPEVKKILRKDINSRIPRDTSLAG